MTKPCIICVAITGSVPTKDDNPVVPITVPEQIESTHEAFEAGASICHAHVRNDDGSTTSDPEKFARLKEGIEKHCAGMIFQVSTGGDLARVPNAAECCPYAPIWPRCQWGPTTFRHVSMRTRPI